MHLEQFDLKDQHSVRKNRSWYSCIAIGQVRADAEPSRAADEHAFDAILEPCNHMTAAERERFFSLAN